MKKIINDLRYDTSKAQAIGSADNLHQGVDSVTDFGYWEAGLYVTAGGNYFLAGEGGPMSMFRQNVGQRSWAGSSDIIPLDKHEACRWAQEHLDNDVVETFFGDRIQDA